MWWNLEVTSLDKNEFGLKGKNFIVFFNLLSKLIIYNNFDFGSKFICKCKIKL